MEKRKLGRQGLEVSAIGLGCMGMSWAYGPVDESRAVRTLHRALELGIDFLDTAEIYGPFKNEELLGRALQGKRDRAILATKFAWRIGPDGTRGALDGSPAHVRESIEGSLKRLRTDHIDLYYQHRLDPGTPIEETVGAMAALVREGKVRYIGLSEVGPQTIRRAHAVHPLSAVQSEYSLWERKVEERVLPALRELGIGLVAYSPVGRGFLTGTVRSVEKLEQDDFRRTLPRFREENIPHNRKLVEEIEKIAAAKKARAGQVALAWILRRGPDIVPIPGTTRVEHLEENARTVELRFPDSDWAGIDRIVSDFTPAGARYTDEMMKLVDSP